MWAHWMCLALILTSSASIQFKTWSVVQVKLRSNWFHGKASSELKFFLNMTKQESRSFTVEGHSRLLVHGKESSYVTMQPSVGQRGAAVWQHCVWFQGERRLWSCGGEAAAYRTSRSCRHLLWKLSHHFGLEIWTSLWAESEVQGGEVYHRAVPHDKGQRLGLRGKPSSFFMTFSKVASPST